MAVSSGGNISVPSEKEPVLRGLSVDLAGRLSGNSSRHNLGEVADGGQQKRNVLEGNVGSVN